MHLITWELSSSTLYFCDQDFRYNYTSASILYESFVIDISGLGESVADREFSNNRIRIKIRNDRWGAYSHLVKLHDIENFVRSALSLYELRLVGGYERFPSDVRNLIWKGTVESIENITQESFDIICSSRLFDKRRALGLEVINTLDFPSADPDDIGKYRNDIYGSVSHVVCRAIKAGWSDTVAEALDDSEQLIDMSASTSQSYPSTPFTMQIDDEKMYVSSRSGNTLTVTRAYSGTTATNHTKGARAFEVLTEYIYEVAKHPVKTISTVFVDGVRQSANFTAYTGQSGDQLAGYGATAVIKFTVKPVISRQVNVVVDEEHGHGMGTGSHGHDSPSDADYTKHVTGHSGSWTDGGQAYDGNIDSEGSVSGGTGYLNLESGDFGDLHIVNLFVYGYRSGAGTQVQWGGTNVGSLSTQIGWHRFTFTTSTWHTTSAVRFYAPGGSTVYVRDVYAIHKYTVGVSAGAASGISATASTPTTLNSSADVVIGSIVHAHVDGYRDDGSGTYTGTPNALIERPDHVLKHILIALLGFSTDDIGDSFASVGSTYSSESFVLAFIIHDIATNAENLLTDLAFEARSYFWEWAGQFELYYLPDRWEEITPDIVLDDDDLIGEPVFSWSSISEVKNKLKIYWDRDYRSLKGLSGSDKVLHGLDQEALAKGFFRMTEFESSTDYPFQTDFDKDLIDEIFLKAVTGSSHITNLGDFLKHNDKIPKLMIDTNVNWRVMKTGPCQHFQYNHEIYGNKVYRVKSFMPSKTQGTVRVEGEFAQGAPWPDEFFEETFEAPGFDNHPWLKTSEFDDKAAHPAALSGGGDYCAKSDPSGGGAGAIFYFSPNISSGAIYTRFYVYIDETSLSSEITMFKLMWSQSGSGLDVWEIRVDTSLNLKISYWTYSDWVVETVMASFPLQTWKRIEIKYDIDNDAAEVKIDGVSEWDNTGFGDDFAGARLNHIFCGVIDGGPATIYLDNIKLKKSDWIGV